MAVGAFSRIFSAETVRNPDGPSGFLTVWLKLSALAGGLVFGLSTTALAIEPPGAAAPAPAAAKASAKPLRTKGTGPTRAEGACTKSESWVFGPAIPVDRQESYESLVDRDMKPAQGFAEGLALRSSATEAETRTFGEFWVSRSLLEAKLFHIAFDGFTVIAAREPEESTAGVQLAALECLLQIQGKYPAFALPKAVAARLPELQVFARTPAQKEVVWTASGAHLRDLVASGGGAQSLEPALALLASSGIHERLGRAIWAARRGDHSVVIRELDQFLLHPAIPPLLKRFVDPARILVSRAYYSTGRFDQAAAQLRQVTKSSNELANSLQELAWAFLLNERYAETIGTAMNLEAGGLRHTFAPEAGMVMAMALNELCQYPESVRSVQLLRKHYEAPYQWLNSWATSAKDGKRRNLYPLAVEYLRKAGTTPQKIASEWVRSPLVISSQEELNLVFDERDSQLSLARSAVVEQRRIGNEIVRLARDLKPRLIAHKPRSGRSDDLPPTVRADLEKVYSFVAQFRRLQQAAPTWMAVLGNYKRKASSLEKVLMARINQDLENRSLRMLAQLEEVAENIQLIEVEIYNGASQDIIWQNAHPDYKDVARKMKDDAMKASNEKVWDWGRAPAGEADEHEIWEDELGSFKANLYNNCSSKDKYLALKLKRRQ
jgi:hypothetical protein